MMDEELLKLKTRHLALGAIRVVRSLPPYSTSREIGQEFVRCATAVGENYRAALGAQSPEESIAKLTLVAENADKCLYWMELLLETDGIPEAELKDLMSETQDIWAMSIASIRSFNDNKIVRFFTQSSIPDLRFKFRTRLTPLSTGLTLFPAFVMLMAAVSLLWIVASPGFWSIFSLVFSLYGFPLLAYRIHQLFYPIKEGISYLRRPEYSPWWGSHQIQAIYITFPALEGLLRLIPGAFSLWLRLWGAKVGRGIYWMPKLEIADRGLIEIGDRVVMGHRVGIYPHVIKPKNNDLMLYIKTVKIGSDVFVGSGSHFGPGVEIADGTYLPVATHLYPNTTIPPDSESRVGAS